MNMDERIKRINELYHKSQNEGLTDEEKLEQTILRQEYVDSIKREYTACFYLNREQSLKQHFWHYGDPELMSYRILNAETGEVVFDHENYERPIHYIRPQDLEE